jgi:hypothetical protein
VHRRTEARSQSSDPLFGRANKLNQTSTHTEGPFFSHHRPVSHLKIAQAMRQGRQHPPQIRHRVGFRPSHAPGATPPAVPRSTTTPQTGPTHRLRWWGIEPTHERSPQGSRAPELLSRGLSCLPLVHLFPHVNKSPLGRGDHLVTLEHHRRGIKWQLELEAPTVNFHRYALRLPREVVDDVLATDLIG